MHVQVKRKRKRERARPRTRRPLIISVPKTSNTMITDCARAPKEGRRRRSRRGGGMLLMMICEKTKGKAPADNRLEISKH